MPLQTHDRMIFLNNFSNNCNEVLCNSNKKADRNTSYMLGVAHPEIKGQFLL